MKRVPLREYARMHKLSLFQVVKKINSGELKSESAKENGQEVRYVLLPEEKPDKSPLPSKPDSEERHGPADESDNPILRELRLLRREVERLRTELERCCKRKE